MTRWLEDEQQQGADGQALMTDVVFRINCASLPVDHADELYKAIATVVPWLDSLTAAGIHQIHVAGSQNGWERPDASPGNELLLSRRTRLRIRIDHQHAEQLIDELTGQNIAFGQYVLRIVSGEKRALAAVSTLLSRYTCMQGIAGDTSDENDFIEQVINECNAIGYSPTKILCGRTQPVKLDGQSIVTRSVLLADIPQQFSVRLQEQGLGEHRSIGCGILIPHKGTGAVRETD